MVFRLDLTEEQRAWTDALETGVADQAMLQAAEKLFPSLPWEPSPESLRLLQDNNLAWIAASATFADIARVLVVSAAARKNTELVADWFRTGTREEKRSILRSLFLLPRPKAYTELAVIACLSSDRPVFDAICYDNPYPAAYFPDAAFNHLIERALYNGRSLERVIGLHARRNENLSRIATSYAHERMAGGRAVPTDLDLLRNEDTSP